MNQSVIKALELLDLFIDQKELSLALISRQADLPRPTAYRLITSLESCGFLRRVKYSDQDIRYRLGLKLMELGNIAAEHIELRKTALPHMQELCLATGEVTHLAITDGDEAVYIEKVESDKQAVRLFTRVGKRSPLHAGSGPKLLLAFLSEEERSQYLQHRTLKPITEYTITDKRQLFSELEEIRRNGFATSDSEQDIDTVGISFPIRDFGGNVIAALGVSGLKYRWIGDRYQYVKECAKITAQKISTDLGCIE